MKPNLEYTIRGETMVRLILLMFITIMVFSFIAFFVFLPPPGIFGTFVVLGVPATGIVLAACRMMRRRKVIFCDNERYVEFVNHRWHSFGRARCELGRVRLEVRPLIVRPKNAFQKQKDGFVLLLRTPFDVIALCAEPTLHSVQQMAHEIGDVRRIDIEYNRYSAIANNL